MGRLERCVGWFQDVSCGWSGGRWKPPDLAAQGWEDPGPLIYLVPADPSPSMTAAPFSRVYGVPLGAHLRELGRDIALPIEACVMMLLSEGMKEEVGLAGAGGEGARAPHPIPPLPHVAWAHTSHPCLCWGVIPPLAPSCQEKAWPPSVELMPPPP